MSACISKILKLFRKILSLHHDFCTLIRMKKTADVLVIGGGIMGCSIAWELAGRHKKVLLLERGEIGREASWAAGGILTPIHLSDYPGPLANLCTASQELYPSFVEEIRRTSGMDPEFHTSGVLFLVLNDTDEDEAKKLEAWKKQRRQPVISLTAEEALSREPALSPKTRRALLLPDINQVRNNRLTHAVAVAAQKRGATFVTQAPAVHFHRRESQIEVETPRDRYSAPVLVIATGAWSSDQAQHLGWSMPVRPVRGQMLLTEIHPPVVQSIVMSRDQYLVPRRDGKLLIGSTVEDAGYDSNTTPEGIEFLKRRGREMVPSLADAPILKSWAGLRPGTPDRLPFIGPVPGMNNVFVAAGHYRNGILLAPVTGQLTAEFLCGERPSLSLEPFRLDRPIKGSAGSA